MANNPVEKLTWNGYFTKEETEKVSKHMTRCSISFIKESKLK